MKTIKMGTQSRQLVGEIQQKMFCICICVSETRVLKDDCCFVLVFVMQLKIFVFVLLPESK